ncbi:MAG: hypothetical protein M1825_005347 [Sarcosagium campestre]|nr:MAG: hypothetical protein M1825_005347 [Sarcosagium campestre]
MKDNRLAVETISAADIDELLERYDGIITKLSKPSAQGSSTAGELETLTQLDAWRLHQLPPIVRTRKQQAASGWLEKEEVIHLISWKLKHGKFRPRLSQLAASNDEQKVRSATKSAYETYSESSANLASALSHLQTLAGIGPASASLLLSVYDPITVPFFSDEFFRWMHYSEGTGRGWDRPIKYNVKEYKALIDKSTLLRDRLRKDGDREFSAVDLERAAYVLRKEQEIELPVRGKAKIIASKNRHADAQQGSISPPPLKRKKVEPILKDNGTTNLRRSSRRL